MFIVTSARLKPAALVLSQWIILSSSVQSVKCVNADITLKYLTPAPQVPTLGHDQCHRIPVNTFNVFLFEKTNKIWYKFLLNSL